MNQDQFKRINKKKYRLPSFGMIMITSFFPVVKAVFRIRSPSLCDKNPKQIANKNIIPKKQ